MGVWGTGNYQNDSAGDTIVGVMKGIAKKIKLRPRYLDELDVAMAYVGAVLALAQTSGEGVNTPNPGSRRGRTKAQHKKNWKDLCDAYLRIFDKEMAETEARKGYKSARRRTIASTFDKIVKGL